MVMESDIEKPKVIAFEVTQHCQYHCPHCRADAGPERTDELTTPQSKKILKAVACFTKCMLIFSGGEPMERRDIYDLIRYAGSLGLKPVLATWKVKYLCRLLSGARRLSLHQKRYCPTYSLQ